MKTVLLGLVVVVLVLAAVLAWRSYLSRDNPPPLGLLDGQLRSCPAKPNCVLSEGADAEHRIEPFPYRGGRANSAAALETALAQLPRTRIESRDGDYWHATQTSALFRFIDDLEFRFDDAAGLIHVRSASRVGYSDLGANRKRVELLRGMVVGQGGGAGG